MQVEVGSADEALALLRRGSRQRQRAETGLNYSSSRSHSIFTVRQRGGERQGAWLPGGRRGASTQERTVSTALPLRCPALQVVLYQPAVELCAPEEGGDPVQTEGLEKLGRMSFVDLAGSERAQRTGNVGVRLK